MATIGVVTTDRDAGGAHLVGNALKIRIRSPKQQVTARLCRQE